MCEGVRACVFVCVCLSVKFVSFNRSGQRRITCHYEKELDLILRDRPSTKPKEVVDTSQDVSDESDEDDVDQSSLTNSRIETDEEDGAVQDDTQEAGHIKSYW